MTKVKHLVFAYRTLFVILIAICATKAFAEPRLLDYYGEDVDYNAMQPSQSLSLIHPLPSKICFDSYTKRRIPCPIVPSSVGLRALNGHVLAIRGHQYIIEPPAPSRPGMCVKKTFLSWSEYSCPIVRTFFGCPNIFYFC